MALGDLCGWATWAGRLRLSVERGCLLRLAVGGGVHFSSSPEETCAEKRAGREREMRRRAPAAVGEASFADLERA